jgi:hypothetical protein
MTFFSRVNLARSQAVAQTAAAQAAALNIPHVVWYREPGLRKLYALTTIIIISSATNGYDGYVFMSVR